MAPPEREGDTMAEETPARPARKGKKAPRLPEGVRIFAKPEVKLIRFGRVVATYRADYATLNVKEARVDLESNSTTTMGGATLSAQRMRLDLRTNRLTADGKVRIVERGVDVQGIRLTALPSLEGIRFGGKVKLKAADRESAEALLNSGRF